MPVHVRLQADKHAAFDTLLARFERRVSSLRRLDPELKLLERRLQAWARWARPLIG